MDHLEMTETLREKAGVSYEEAREALERNNWDLLGAIVDLEKQGRFSARKGGRDSGKHPKGASGERQGE